MPSRRHGLEILTPGHSRALSLIRSDIAGVEWPPISSGPAAVLAALLRQLEDTQWLSQEELLSLQHRQLRVLADHAEKQSKHFNERLRRAGLRSEDLADRDGLLKLPVLGRRDIQAAGKSLYCAQIPPGQRPVGTAQTSGSTGEPVVVRRTAISRLFWMAMTMRDHLWHGRDFSKGLSAIRANIASYKVRSDWGAPVKLLYRSGPAQGIPITTDIKRQADLLLSFKPDSLLIYPSNLDVLSQYCGERKIEMPELRHIRTIGETLLPRIRERASRVFDATIADCYSSQEVGIIAVQCPDSGLYHVMAEGLIVEVLDESGAACAPSQVGRVVVTDLHNFATPLVRYDIGDYAEAAGPCPCGRGLPALKRVLGRERNLILMPDGSRHWPLVGFARFREIAPISQYQFIQDGRESIEVRLVSEAPVTGDQEAGLRTLIQEALGHPFQLTFTYFETEIPRGPGGKFEEFICKVSDAQGS